MIILNKKTWNFFFDSNNKIYYAGLELKNFIQNKKYICKKNLIQQLKYINSQYGLIVENGDNILAFTDCVSSYPLIYGWIGNRFLLSDNIFNFKYNKINQIAKEEIISCGYTLDNKTIFQNIKWVKPNNIFNKIKNKIYLKNNNLSHKFNYNKPIFELKNLHSELFKDCIKNLNNRTAVIPLSAGLDSRLILTGLLSHNYKKIVTFSYGPKNHYEIKAAKKICSYLGIKNIQVYTKINDVKKFYKSDLLKKYSKFYDTGTNALNFQDIYPLYLIRNQIPRNSVIINGQTGDFISGGHLPINIKKIKNKEFYNKMYEKFCNLWISHKIKPPKNIVINNLIKLTKKEKTYEKKWTQFELINRNAKYILSGQRAYELLGYDWLLPLWNKKYVNFWLNCPVNLKIRQNLYKKVLVMQNYCNIWKDNKWYFKKYDSPLWARLIRFLFKKILSHFVSNVVCKYYENKFFLYFTSNLRGMAYKKYFDIIKSKHFFRNELSFLAEDYIKKHDI